ncbi:scaffolding protein [Mycobacterium phage ZoeJ]|uniref:Scaffolding protein n=1 Tax=Mycobacterium phage ZoeJ TaxID=1486427 RepID=A0A023W6S9_9CAUD|nr:head scaffolding protein [Mycobacterium phage ZoeJ]AHY26832.1 scaffolding protein [Mycobacterium phage ZoeJ]
MPDTETATDTETTTETGSTETATDATETADNGELGDGGKKALAAEREARKQAEKDLAEARKALKAIEDKEKSELQREREAREAAEKRAEQAEFTSLRNKVAAAKGVPASSLTGKTEDELNASADELIAWRDQHKPPAPPKRSPAQGGGLKSGATGNGNTNSDPKAAAAEALRRLRAGG